MRQKILLISWLLTDLAVFVGSFAASYFLRVGWILSTDFPFDRFIIIAAMVSPLWLVVLIMTRTFNITRNQTTPRNIAYICYASVIGTALFAVSYYFFYGLFFSRRLLIYTLIITAILTWIWHIVFQQIQRILLRKNPPVFPTLIVGATRESKKLIENLNKHRNPLKPVAVLDGRGTKESDIGGVPVRGKLNKLEEVLEGEKITHLIQCSDLEQSMNLLSACRTRGITYMLLPSVLGIIERDERVEPLEGQPVTMVSPKRGLWNWFFS